MRLNARRIGILTTDGFDDAALNFLREELRSQGAEVRLLSLLPDSVQGWSREGWSDRQAVDLVLDDVALTDFDALVIPPGLIAVDTLKATRYAVNFVSRFAAGHRLVVAIGHAPLFLNEAGLIRGRTVTGTRSIRTELRNAGAHVREDGPRRDGMLITAADNGELLLTVNAIADGFMTERSTPEAA
ncbi:DJ-1/PfpI family protein [Notoacmeibacter ruber]|uniref:Protease n=1 Tax=Notoacmeibacter ruber TaxID=2670375 RepID=A0A3L7JBQ8_9HYPH|nr:DJ-1/PfpI family protein [Notoacmeibacter ruber]RLQ86961.1 protease [Notoacmeibacter ruber]